MIQIVDPKPFSEFISIFGGKNMMRFLLLLFAGFYLSSCANTYQAREAGLSAETVDEAPVSFPDYSGEKTRIAVLPIAMTRKTIADFPEYTKELRKKSVGFSLWNRITETLYDTRRFRFIEISEEVVKQIIEQWWLGKSGLVDPGTALKMGKLKQAEDFIYGEITEFGADSVESVKGFRGKEEVVYRLGVQLRYVDGETLEYIPATGRGKGTTISRASERAIRNAVLKLLERMD
jgi:hypothetical protein